MNTKVLVGVFVGLSSAAALVIAPRVAKSGDRSPGVGEGVAFVDFSCAAQLIPSGQTNNSCPPGQDFQSATLNAGVQAMGVAGVGTPTVSASPFSPTENCVPAGTSALAADYCSKALRSARVNGCDTVAFDDESIPQQGGGFTASGYAVQHCVGVPDFLVGAFDRAVRTVYGLAPHPVRGTH